MKKTLTQRFNERFTPEPSCGCWLWVGAVDKHGYGRISVGGRSTSHMKLAYRVSWELHNGPVPDGLYVLHRCDLPACVNPDHLEVGTQSKNILDSYERGRDRRSENNHNARLTNDQARQIRASTHSYRKLAKAFGVSASAIAKIKTGKMWKYLT